MSVDALWPVAQIVYSLAAAGTVGIAWAIFTRGSHERDTLLVVASLIALGLHYGALAIDAHLHAVGIARAMFTMWSGLGQTLATLCWALLMVDLLIAVTRVRAPEHAHRRLTWFAGGFTALLATHVVSMYARVLVDMMAGQGPDILQTRLRHLMSDAVPSALFLVSPNIAFTALYARLPAHERSRWIRWLSGPRHTWRLPDGEDDPSGAHGTSGARHDVRGLLMIYGTAALLVGTTILPGRWQEWMPGGLTLWVVLHLLLLPSVVGVLYYEARFLFFDVVVKRGLLYLSLVTVMATTWYVVARAVLPVGGAEAAWVSIAATLCVWGAAMPVARADRWLDRVIFGRPDYRAALRDLFEAMAGCADTHALRATVTTRLASTFGAAFVRHQLDVVPTSQLAIGLGTPDRHRGYLSLGPRPRGQRYNSEEVNFIEAVAAQFAGLLASFEARQAHHLASVAELKALRAQINPHFLFNALNTLAQMARDHPSTERAILNLSRVFRHALESTQRETVPLAVEIEAIRAYLEIERERFESRLRFEIEVPDELVATPVPPMLLQPLVENALKHGLGPKVEGGQIRITAVRHGDHLRVTVADDGVGFEPGRAVAHVGMANVRTRLEKSGGSWVVQSVPGYGTQITLDVAIA